MGEPVRRGRYEAIQEGDSYADTLAALLPAELVAIYTGLNGMVMSKWPTPPTGSVPEEQWIAGLAVFGFSLAVTIAYLLYRRTTVEDPTKQMGWPQLVVTCLSFAIWALAVGDLLNAGHTKWWDSGVQQMIMAAWTMTLPLFFAGPKALRGVMPPRPQP